MTVQEKHDALCKFCNDRPACSGCPLHISKFQCGRGKWFDRAPGTYNFIKDEDIVLMHDIVFPPVPTIKDSGTRQEFPTGAVRDIQKGKGRCDLLPLDVIADCYRADFGMEEPEAKIFDNVQRFMETGLPHHLYNALAEFIEMAFDNCWSNMLLEVSMHFEEGAEKYGENNWQKGLPVKCYINSAVRHFLKYLREDTDERHDRAFCWNILCAIWTDKHKPELNDYGKKHCPVCGTEIPTGEDNCPHCRVFIGKPTFDPDDFMGEYEEEIE